MTSDAMTLYHALPQHLHERTRWLNRRPLNRDGGYVLYWMHHAVRGHENPALDAAVWMANRLELPVLVYQGLGGRHAYNSDRHHTFIMQGAIDAQSELAASGITHHFHLAYDPQKPSPLRQLAAEAALTLTEDFPAPPYSTWAQHLARASTSALWAVDTACILPMQLLDKSYARAYQFRQAAWPQFEARISSRHESPTPLVDPIQPPPQLEGLDLASADIAALIAKCRIDHTVGPVSGTRGGSVAGYDRWEQFKAHGLSRYAELRNDAVVAFPMGVSRMSAYLHHGHVAPSRIAREAAASNGPGADKFLDELLIWRELAHNFCFFNARPDRLSALPEWALATLNDHRGDERASLFSWETLAMGHTGDALWDAAQASLRIHGELHNNLRMTWGKALLQWTPSPELALGMMIDLNHRYALDGSDPNSYGGILWCLGLFDRAFKPEKTVIGRLRPRSTRSHAARLDLPAYAARVTRPSAPTAQRVAVIGAGLSGLVVARTLAGHGHRVKVFEKARGPGGRMSTRHTEGYAFDHGAQYFTARDPHFQDRVAFWETSGLVRPWEGRVRVIRDGRVQKEKQPHRRYVGVPGMSAVARHLADGLDISWSTQINSVRKIGNGRVIMNTDGHSLGTYDGLVTTAPAEQSVRFLAGHTALADQLAGIRMAPCWAVMLAFDAPLALPYDAAFVHGAELSWVARNSSKPGRGQPDTWVLHASAAWTATHLHIESDEAVRRLTAAFFAVTRCPAVEPAFAAAHRWRYAQAQQPLQAGALWDGDEMIGACGDWSAGSRVEGAYLSGAAMAGRILAHIA